MAYEQKPPHQWRKGQSGNPAGRKPGTQILREVIGDDGIRAFAMNLKKLADENNATAMGILADRLFPRAMEEPVRLEGYDEAKSFDEKSDIIMRSMTEGEISISQGERLMSTLLKQVTIYASTKLVEDVEALKQLVKGH